MTRARGRFAGIVGLVGLAGLMGLGACGGDEPPSTQGVVAMLEQVPEVRRSDEATVVLTFGDLELATELAGVDRATDPGDERELVDWLAPITGLDSSVHLMLPAVGVSTSIDEVDEIDDELGFSVVDVDRFLEVQRLPERFVAMVGEIDGDDLAGALGEADDGVFTAGEGDDFTVDPRGRTAARPLGSPLHLGLRDGVVGATSSSPLVHDWLRDDGSMADDAGLLTVATRLNEADVYAATLVATDERAESDNPYDTVGVGLAMDDDGPLGVIVYRYDDDAAADDAAEVVSDLLDGTSLRTGEPWSTAFDDWDVTADVDTVVVTIRLHDDRVGVLWSALAAADSLFAPA